MPKGKKRQQQQRHVNGGSDSEDENIPHQQATQAQKYIQADELSIYRSNLMNPLLNELVVANRLGTLQEAKLSQDQLKFSGLYKVEQYVKELKSALDAVPALNITAYPGDIVAGVQIHQSAGAAGLSITTAPPSAVDLSGSYLHGTSLTSNNNVDITLTLPHGFYKNDKEFQNYTYFDKRAMYVSAIAFHLKNYKDLKFANLFITHEPNDTLKPIIIIQPSTGLGDYSENSIPSKNVHLPTPKGMLGKAFIVLHFAAPINSIALRKLAPNRNNVKTLEHQTYIDHSDDLATHRLSTTSLGESMSIPNIAPTPYYNHQIIQDMLSLSSSYTYLTILQQCPLLQYIICAAKVWLKLRGLYLDTNNSAILFIKQSEKAATLCNTIKDLSIPVQYNKLLTSPNNTEMFMLYQKSSIYYHYTSHYYNNNHQYGLNGTTLTHIITNLYLNGKITTQNNIQHGLDQFFRYLLLHYPDNLNAPPQHSYLPVSYSTLNNTHATPGNLMFGQLILPPDFDGSITLSTLQQSQEDYSAIYENSNGSITPALLYHSFDVVMLDHNNIYNILFNTMTIQGWHQIQMHALYSLKAIYGNNMGSLLSHEITPKLLMNNYSLILQHCTLAPLTDEEVFQCIYMTHLNNNLKYNSFNDTSGMMDFDTYINTLHSLYTQQIELIAANGTSTEITTHSLDQQATLMGDDNSSKYDVLRDEYLLLQQQHPDYNNDSALLQYDHVFEVSLPANYLPFYPVVNAYLHTKRTLQQAAGHEQPSKPHAKKSASTAAKSTSVKLADDYLQNELLIKVNMMFDEQMPLYIPNTAGDHVKASKTSFPYLNKFRNKKFTQTTYGEAEIQTAEQITTDGDITKYIPSPHHPTKASYHTITQRITNILLHSLTNRYYSLYVEPHCNLTLTSFTWRVYLNFNKAEASRGLDKGPFAEQQLKCKEWVKWWGGNKSELRRFPDGSIMETVVWNHSPLSYPLSHEQLAFIITQYILPLHLFTSTTAPVNNIYFYSNKCTVSTIAHPLGAFLQTKTDQHLVDPLAESSTSPIIPDMSQPIPYQHNNQSLSTIMHNGAMDKFVSNSAPLPTTLLTAYNNLATMLKEMKSLPLNVESVQCTSSVIRGTSPFYPKQHIFEINNPPTIEMINHFFASLPCAEAITNSTAHPHDNVNNHYIYEPINVLLNLSSSNKWPQNDLLAISRVKTAFYLKLGSIIRTEYTDGHIRRSVTFEEAQKKVLDKQKNKGHAKKGGKDSAIPEEGNTNVGHIYCQITPYYIDIYINGYVFRCRIVVPHEISVFRTQTSSRHSIPPLALHDGMFRAFEREYIYRPQHHDIMKNVASTFPIFTTASQFIYRWLTSHFVTRHFSIELCELLVASVFVNSAPFTVPTTLHSTIIRVFHRLATWDFEQRPILVPNISFMTSQNNSTLKKGTNTLAISGVAVDVPLLLQQHKQDVTFGATEYESDIHIDLLPQIYGAFLKRSRDNTRALIYLVTSYDHESRAWTMRPNNALNYVDHFQSLIDRQSNCNGTSTSNHEDPVEAIVFKMLSLTDLHNKQQKELERTEEREMALLQRSIVNNIDDSDDENSLVSLQITQEQEQEQQLQLYKQYYLSLIDKGDDCRYTENTYNLISSINHNDLVQIQLLSSAALPAFKTLLHFTSSSYNYIPSLNTAIIPQQRQLGFLRELNPFKTPQQWVFKHYLGLFKPQLTSFDAFIVLNPNALTVDAISKSLWLFKNKDVSLTSDHGEYVNFIARSTQDPEIYSMLHQSNKKKDKQSKYKLPPDLARKLQQEESAKLAENGGGLDPNLHYTLFVDVDFVSQYLDELRGKFGQIASFYSNHKHGNRVICVKFHSFITHSSSTDDSTPTNNYTLQHLQQRIQRSCTNAKNKNCETIRDINAPDDHLIHPTQTGLHLLGLAPISKHITKKNKITALEPQLDDLVKQMAFLGRGLVQQTYVGVDSFLEHIYF